MDPRYRATLDAFNDFHVNLRREHLPRLGTIYTDDVHFKDPFHDVRGRDQIMLILSDMFDSLDDPSYRPVQSVLEGNHAFVVWDFEFTMKRWDKARQSIRGVSHLVFAEDGRICSNRNYWDTAEELFGKLPLIGAIMRLLKSAVQAPSRKK